jgi:hypothetical protein
MVNLPNLNEYIASSLANLFKINDTKNFDRFYHEVLTDVTPLPQMKFIEMFSAPYTYYKRPSTGPESTWETVISSCLG